MRNATQSPTTRRDFLVRSAATAAGAFLSVGLPGVLPGSSAEAAAGAAMPGFTPSIWFTITPDGKVTMHIVKAEMGQHVGTALAQVIAEELEARWGACASQACVFRSAFNPHWLRATVPAPRQRRREVYRAPPRAASSPCCGTGWR